MRRILPWIIVLIMLAWAVALCRSQRFDWRVIARFPVWLFAVIAVSRIVAKALLSQGYFLVLRRLGLRTLGALQWFRIFIVGQALNKVVGQSGTVYSAVHLKMGHGFDYTKSVVGYSAFIWMDALLNTLLATLVVLCYDPQLRMGGVSAALAGVLLFLLLLATPFILRLAGRAAASQAGSSDSWLARAARSSSQAIHAATDWRLVLAANGVGLAAFVVNTVSIYLVFHGLEVVLTVPQTAIFACILRVSTLVSITPGNLGIRELTYGYLGRAAGAGAGEAMVASMLLRLVDYAVLALLGLTFAVVKADRTASGAAATPGEEGGVPPGGAGPAPRVLFLSRAHPPVVGGIENQNHELSLALARVAPVVTIANRGGRKFLPVFLPWAAMRALFLAPKHDVILLGDGVLAVVGWVIKKLRPSTRVCSIVHGLDLTYDSAVYQRLWVRVFLAGLDRLFAVSHATIEAGVRQGLPRDKFIFIPNGVDAGRLAGAYSRKGLTDFLGLDTDDHHILLTCGRLVKRKGVAWFVKEVLPRLPDNVLYVVAGDGPEDERIRQATREADVEGRVRMLGRVSDHTRNLLLNTADVFVQPNIPVPGDMEGFGLSVLEAAACRLPVVASRIDGLADAVVDAQNGTLVAPADARAFASAVNALLADDNRRCQAGATAQRYVKEHCGWETIAGRYLSALAAETSVR